MISHKDTWIGPTLDVAWGPDTFRIRTPSLRFDSAVKRRLAPERQRIVRIIESHEIGIDSNAERLSATSHSNALIPVTA
jgi:hypothetical protein